MQNLSETEKTTAICTRISVKINISEKELDKINLNVIKIIII